VFSKKGLNSILKKLYLIFTGEGGGQHSQYSGKDNTNHEGVRWSGMGATAEISDREEG